MKRIIIIMLLATIILSSCSTGEQPATQNTEPQQQPEEITNLDTPLGESETKIQEESENSEEQAEQVQEETHVARVTLPETISVVENGITVQVDPMLELLYIMKYLGDFQVKSDIVSNVRTSYQDDIDALFGEFKDHDAIKYMSEASDGDFSFDRPPAACLYLNKDFSYSENYADSGLNQFYSEEIEGMRKNMEQFCLDTNFNEFFESHKVFYFKMIEKYVEENLPDWNVVSAVESYYGYSKQGYVIDLVTLCHSGGYGPEIKKAEGNYLHCIHGPTKEVENVPTFWINPDLFVHEFGHSFIRIAEYDSASVPDNIKQAIQRSTRLFDLIYEKMLAIEYKGWDNVYEELILRATVIDILSQNTDMNIDKMLKFEEQQGFTYIYDIYEKLQDYNNNREKYPNINSFVPVITDSLLELYPE